MFRTFQTEEESLRTRLINRLGLRAGSRVLVTGSGTCNDLPFIARSLSGSGEIYAQDFSAEMLLFGISRHIDGLAQLGVGCYFSVSDATNLPFSTDFFDAAYHFGGINAFSDRALAVAEMNRVVKQGGKIVIGDEGIAPWLVDTEFGQMLITNNSLYASVAPLSELPPEARNVKLTWELSNCFYVIEFESSALPLAEEIDVDVPHLGRRGGSVRTRYFGQLEGIDPSLRDWIYREAEQRGISRVAFLEKVLRKEVEKLQ